MVLLVLSIGARCRILFQQPWATHLAVPVRPYPMPYAAILRGCRAADWIGLSGEFPHWWYGLSLDHVAGMGLSALLFYLRDRIQHLPCSSWYGHSGCEGGMYL